MGEQFTEDALRGVPRLGWVEAPSPVTPLPELARAWGLASLAAKRDDLLPALHGGTKVRKLDALLAQPAYRRARRWASVGAMGSGHLVALAAAAERLGATLDAHVFWEPPSEPVLENLAWLASQPVRLTWRADRATLALREPRILLSQRWADAAVVPPGAASPTALVGVVAAGLELCRQVEAGELPAPDVVYVARGTGGIAAGLAVGLALGGLRPEIRAISAVEWCLSRTKPHGRQVRALLERLRGACVPLPRDLRPAPVRVDHRFVGRRYGDPTEAALEACRQGADLGLPLEPVYSGKAWAALRADAPRLAGRHTLFWVSPHRPGLPARPDWRDRLPPALAARLADPDRPGLTRRCVLVGAGASALAAAGVVRLTDYDRLPAWDGRVLARWEAETVAAAAEALLPDVPGGPLTPGPAEIAANVDRYLTGMPAALLAEVHAMMALVEHGTPLGGRLRRLTRLPPDARVRHLTGLVALPGPASAAWRGIRDLVMVGYYQDPRTWEAIGYTGPWVPPGGLGGPGRYDALVAPAGALPRGVVP